MNQSQSKCLVKAFVRESPLYVFLTKKTPTTIIDNLAWASKYINLEEDKRQYNKKNNVEIRIESLKVECPNWDYSPDRHKKR